MAFVLRARIRWARRTAPFLCLFAGFVYIALSLHQQDWSKALIAAVWFFLGAFIAYAVDLQDQKRSKEGTL